MCPDSDGFLAQDLEDLHDRWIRAIARSDYLEARRAFEAIDEYVRARDPPVFPGGAGVLVRISKEGPL